MHRFTPPELDIPKSCHQILGVQRGVSADEVTLAFLRIALPCHPAHGDALADPAAAARRLREAATAWTVLAVRSIPTHGDGADAHALRALDEALFDEARRLATRGARAARITDTLVAEGCPPSIATLAAERAAAAVPSPRGTRAGARASDPEPAQGLAKASGHAAPVARDALGRPRPGGAAPETAPTAPHGDDAPRTRRARDTAARRKRRGVAAPEDWAPRYADVLVRLGLRRADPVPQPEDEAFEPLPVVDATLRQRVAAAGFDAVLLLALCGTPAFVAGWLSGASPMWVARAVIAAVLLGGLVLHVFGELGWGASPGKRLLDLRVESEDGYAPDLRTACLRHGLRTMSWCLLGLGHLCAVPLRPSRTLHDLLTSTRVTTATPPREDLERALCVLAVVAAVVAAVGYSQLN